MTTVEEIQQALTSQTEGGAAMRRLWGPGDLLYRPGAKEAMEQFIQQNPELFQQAYAPPAVGAYYTQGGVQYTAGGVVLGQEGIRPKYLDAEKEVEIIYDEYGKAVGLKGPGAKITAAASTGMPVEQGYSTIYGYPSVPIPIPQKQPSLFDIGQPIRMDGTLTTSEMIKIEKQRESPIFQAVFATEKIFTGEAIAKGLEYILAPEREKYLATQREEWLAEQRSIWYRLGKGKRQEVFWERASPMMITGGMMLAPIPLGKWAAAGKTTTIFQTQMTGLALTGISGGFLAMGTSEVLTGWKTLFEESKPSTVGSGLITAGFGAMGVKAGWQTMFPMKLEIPLEDLTPKQRAKYERMMAEAKAFEDVRPPVKELPLAEVKRLPKTARHPLSEFLKAEKDVIVGGSLAQRTQLYGKKLKGISDIDLFASKPIESGRALYYQLKSAGIKDVVLKIKREGTIMESSKLFLSGRKTIEFHTHMWRRSFKYLDAPRTTPSGIKVVDITEQIKRKVVGGTVAGRTKDLLHFKEIKIGLGSKKGTVSYPYYNIMKDVKFVPYVPQVYKGKGYYFKPSVYKPTIYKPTKPYKAPPYKPTATYKAPPYKPPPTRYKPPYKKIDVPYIPPYKPIDTPYTPPYKPPKTPIKTPRQPPYVPPLKFKFDFPKFKGKKSKITRLKRRTRPEPSLGGIVLRKFGKLKPTFTGIEPIRPLGDFRMGKRKKKRKKK
jgi:hypothetical protein